MLPKLASTLALALLLSACNYTFVKMAPGADRVKVLRADQDTRHCEKRGEVAVSVKDRLGPYQRDEIRVIDELETLARNEAPGLGADTVQPMGPPKDGEQRWRALRCSAAAAAPAGAPVAAMARDEAQTLPLQE